MRKLIVGLVVVVALVFAYSIYWHKKAGEFKQMFAQAVEAINMAAKPFARDDAFVQYDGLQVTGFPFSMAVEMIKPTFTVPVSALLSRLPHDTSVPMPYDWTEKLEYRDKMVFSGTATGDHYTFSIRGDQVQTAYINKKARHQFIVNSRPLSCTVRLSQTVGGSPWSMQSAFAEPEMIASIFRALECRVEDIAVKDVASGATILTIDGLSSSTGLEEAGGVNFKTYFKADVRNIRAAKAFDGIAKDFARMGYTLFGKQKLAESLPSVASEYGEQNAKIDVSYVGPLDPKLFEATDLNLRLDVNALSLENALYNISAQSHVSNLPQGMQRVVSQNTQVRAEVKPHYVQLLQQTAAAYLADAMDTAGKKGDALKFAQSIALMGTPTDLSVSLVPQLHTFGKMGLDINMSIRGPNDKTLFFTQSVAKLDKLDAMTELYGIKMKGTSDMSIAGLPVGETNVTCVSCDTMIDDMGNWAMRYETVFDRVAKKPPVLTRAIVEGTKQFLHGISENSESKDLQIDYVLRNMVLLVSGKTLADINSIFQSTLAPVLPPPPDMNALMKQQQAAQQQPVADQNERPSGPRP